MTIEEKKREIEQYCDSKQWCTVDQDYPCPLYGYNEDCFDTDDVEIINRNFALVSAMPDYKGQKETTNEDIVNHPNHYTNCGMECINEMILVFGREVVSHFCLCNVWKYRYRALFKNGQQDIDKSHWYMKKYLELRGCESNEQVQNI